MHSRRVLSFFANSTGAPHGEVLSLMKPLPSNSCIWTLSSYNSTGVILCGAIEIGDVPRCNSMRKSTSLSGGNPVARSEKHPYTRILIRGRSKSCLTSSSRVRLASQPINCPCHLESYMVWGKSIVLVPLKRNESTILCVGGNSPTLTIDNDSVCCQPIHP